MHSDHFNKITFVWLIVAFLFLITISCSPKTESPPEPGPDIRIGFIVYSDQDARRTESNVNAAEMAVDEINSSGGINIEGKTQRVVTVRVDVRGSVPEESVEAVTMLINRKNVIAIVGPQFSTDAIPAGVVAEKARVPLISPMSTNPRTTLEREFVFRMGFLDDHQGRAAVRFLREDLDLKNSAVIFNITNPYSREIAKVFKENFESAGGFIVAFESYTTAGEALSSKLRRIRDAQPQVLYIPSLSTEPEVIATQARRMGIDAILMGTDGWNPQRLSRITEFDGSYMTAHYSDQIRTEKNLEFVNSFQERFGVLPGDVAALTYDAFQMIFEAIKFKGKADPVSIRNGLYEMGPYDSVGGPVDFVNNGDPVKGVVILQLKDGESRFVRITDAG